MEIGIELGTCVGLTIRIRIHCIVGFSLSLLPFITDEPCMLAGRPASLVRVISSNLSSGSRVAPILTCSLSVHSRFNFSNFSFCSSDMSHLGALGAGIRSKNVVVVAVEVAVASVEIGP